MNRTSLTRAILAAFTACIALVAAPQMAQAYEFIYNCSGGGGAAWSSANQPLTYYINSRGSDDTSFSSFTKLEGVIQDSFDVWSSPCSSNFQSTYGGSTSDTALNTNNPVVLSWAETRNEWPQQLGDPFGGTIAVTLASATSACTMRSAPIIFNGIAITYTDQCNTNFCSGGGTDLQSIATHEIGHMLGLAHSPIQSATMYFAYQGGSGARTIATDDQNGVSALYPRACTCTQDSDCTDPDEQCIQGTCSEVPCMSNNDCDPGLECNLQTGDCEIPPCTSNADCGTGFTCDNGTCRSQCPVCRDCTSSNECGGNAVCSDVGRPTGKCIVFCSQNGSCPGDAQCFQYSQQGQTYYLCLNPNVNQAGICPSNYTCMNPQQPQDPCDNVSCDPVTEVCRDGVCEPRDFPDPVDMGTPPEEDMKPPTQEDMGPIDIPEEDMGPIQIPEEDMSAPPSASDMGTNVPADMGTTSGNNDDDPVIIVPGGDDDGSANATDDGCNTVSVGQTSGSGWPLGLLLGAIFGLGRRLRRRR